MPFQCSQGAEIVGQVVTAGPRVYSFPNLRPFNPNPTHATLTHIETQTRTPIPNPST